MGSPGVSAVRCERICVNPKSPALLVSSTRPDAARALLADAGWTDASLLDVSVIPGAALRGAARPTAAPTTEVHA